MILADHPFDNPNLKGFTGLPHEFSNALTDIPDQYLESPPKSLPGDGTPSR
jgi:hypothetical protein